jgi:formylmethanofuran dehydrogenase subunit E
MSDFEPDDDDLHSVASAPATPVKAPPRKRAPPCPVPGYKTQAQMLEEIEEFSEHDDDDNKDLPLNEAGRSPKLAQSLSLSETKSTPKKTNQKPVLKLIKTSDSEGEEKPPAPPADDDEEEVKRPSKSKKRKPDVDPEETQDDDDNGDGSDMESDREGGGEEEDDKVKPPPRKRAKVEKPKKAKEPSKSYKEIQADIRARAAAERKAAAAPKDDDDVPVEPAPVVKCSKCGAKAKDDYDLTEIDGEKGAICLECLKKRRAADTDKQNARCTECNKKGVHEKGLCEGCYAAFSSKKTEKKKPTATTSSPATPAKAKANGKAEKKAEPAAPQKPAKAVTVVCSVCKNDVPMRDTVVRDNKHLCKPCDAKRATAPAAPAQPVKNKPVPELVAKRQQLSKDLHAFWVKNGPKVSKLLKREQLEAQMTKLSTIVHTPDGKAIGTCKTLFQVVNSMKREEIDFADHFYSLCMLMHPQLAEEFDKVLSKD